MTIFLITALLIQPWIIFPIAGLGDQMRLPQMAFLGIIYFGMICLFFLNGAKYVYRNKWLALLSAWIFFGIFLNFILPFCLDWAGRGRMLNIGGLDQIIYFILGLFATYIALSTLEKDDFQKIAKALCFSAMLMSIWAILQYIGFDPFGKIAVYRCENRVSACLDNPNLVGNYLTLCLPMFFLFDKKYLLGLVLTLIGVYVTHSHFAVALSILSLFLFGSLYFRDNKWVRRSLLAIPVISFPLVLKFDYFKLFNNMSSRWDCWVLALDKLKANPLFGQGLGVWKTWMIRIDTTYWLYVHNDWLEKAIEIGLIGVGLAFLVIINSIRHAKLDSKLSIAYFSMFISFIIMMFFSFPLVVPTLGFLGLISFWGIERL